MACLRRSPRPIDFDAGSVPVETLDRLEATGDDFRAAGAEVEPSAIPEVFVERTSGTLG